MAGSLFGTPRNHVHRPVKKLLCRGDPIHEGRSGGSRQSSKNSRFAAWFPITKKLPVRKFQRGARPDFYDSFATNIWDWTIAINHLRVFYMVFEKERKENTAKGERRELAVITGARDLYHDERDSRIYGTERRNRRKSRFFRSRASYSNFQTLSKDVSPSYFSTL